MCSVPPQKILKHPVSSVVSLAQLVSSSVALPAELVTVTFIVTVIKTTPLVEENQANIVWLFRQKIRNLRTD